MTFRRAIGSPTKAQQEKQDAARALGCIACRVRGMAVQCGPTRIHHRTTGDLHGQKQLGQDFFVALGDWHHQGIRRPGWTQDAMTACYGPSLHHHKRDFVEWLQDALGQRSTAALQRVQDELLASSK